MLEYVKRQLFRNNKKSKKNFDSKNRMLFNRKTILESARSQIDISILTWNQFNFVFQWLSAQVSFIAFVQSTLCNLLCNCIVYDCVLYCRIFVYSSQLCICMESRILYKLFCRETFQIKSSVILAKLAFKRFFSKF